MRWIAALRPRPDDDGFSLIELVMAIFIFSVITTALGYVLTGSMVNVAFARQRQVANHLATQAMEQVRALPFSTLAAGLDRTDLATADPNVSVIGSGATAVYTFTPTSETIPTGTSGTAQVPLNPHRQTKVVNGTTYTVAVYPTNYQGSTTSFRATVIASWTGSFRKGLVANVSTQTSSSRRRAASRAPRTRSRRPASRSSTAPRRWARAR